MERPADELGKKPRMRRFNRRTVASDDERTQHLGTAPADFDRLAILHMSDHAAPARRLQPVEMLEIDDRRPMHPNEALAVKAFLALA